MKTTHTYPDTHTDHITSFLPLANINPHHVLSTSGDCTLSVFDLRKTSALATSEDQEDELLCSAFTNDSRRIITGTQSGFVTLWKSGEWLDHVDRISPAERTRKGDEAPSVDCMIQFQNDVMVGSGDGAIRRLGFRPNQYLEVIGRCEDGVTGLVAVPEMEGWIVAAAGTKVAFWDTNAVEGEEEDEKGDSSEEERSRKRRKKGKKARIASNVEKSAFFADL
jgi:WD repeat-containing protein 55